MKLTLQLSCYNGARYLPYLFESLRSQSAQNWRMVMLDNASNPDEKSVIEQAVKNAGFPIELFRVEENIGFAGAHNFLFQKHKSESTFVALLNDDAILEPTYLDVLIATLKARPEIASTSGMIYRWDFDKKENANKGKTDIIDTRGLSVSKTGAVSDIGSGKILSITDAPSKPESVFGVSGCLPCYRTSAINQVSLDGNLFDASFVIYKEDVELAFRLQEAGYSSATMPNAIAYHRRALGQGTRRSASSETLYQSYRNHLWIHLMHTRVCELFTTRFLLLPYEILKITYWLLRKPSSLWRTWSETKQQWENLMCKRSFHYVLREATKQRNKKPSILLENADVDIAVIMVSHNDLSEACLRSYEEAKNKTNLRVKLIVADNKSHTYAANEFVQKIAPDAIVLLRNEDFGYGRSCNRAAKELTASYYFILNPDTVLTDLDIFDKFYAYMNAHPDVGIVAPKIFYFDGKLQETCRRFPKWYVPFVTRTRLQQSKFGKRYMDEFTMQDYNHTEKRNVDWVQGSAMFIDGNLWRSIDGFDDRYWLYFEDIDLCRRVHLSGKKIIYDPQTTLQHAHGKESATYSNLLVNLVKKKEARGHIISWLKYIWKWRGK